MCSLRFSQQRILGRPKSSFRVLHKMWQKMRMNILPNPYAIISRPGTLLRTKEFSCLWLILDQYPLPLYFPNVLWTQDSNFSKIYHKLMYKVHSIMYRGFLMGLMGDRSPLGKASGQKVHILPQSSIPIFLSNPFVPWRLSGFLVNVGR